MKRKQQYDPGLRGLDPLSKEFHKRQVYRAEISQMGEREIVGEYVLLKSNEPKRIPRPANIPAGASWTTKESIEYYDRLSLLMSYMTRDEIRKAEGVL